MGVGYSMEKFWKFNSLSGFKFYYETEIKYCSFRWNYIVFYVNTQRIPNGKNYKKN